MRFLKIMNLLHLEIFIREKIMKKLKKRLTVRRKKILQKKVSVTKKKMMKKKMSVRV